MFTAFINSFINANVSAKRVIPYLLAEDAEGFNTGDNHKTHTIGTDTMEDKVNMIYLGHIKLKAKFFEIAVLKLYLVSNFHLFHRLFFLESKKIYIFMIGQNILYILQHVIDMHKTKSDTKGKEQSLN